MLKKNLEASLKKREKWIEVLYLLFVFLFVWKWSRVLPYNTGPDEYMRYDVVRWLYEHPWQLPHGGDPALRDSTWGISYAFYPILSYMLSAVFMHVGDLFGAEVPLWSARMAGVLFTTGSTWMMLLASKKLFQGWYRWLFVVLVTMLPNFIFIGAYVNTDSLAMFSAAVLFYVWASYLKEGWSWKNCVVLAVGMALCALSYYNAYGWILCSFFFFCLTVLFCSGDSWKKRIQFLLSRGIVISLITFAGAGWWFIRNIVLYDGDILGRNICTEYAERYAVEQCKPSNRITPSLKGMRFKEMLFYVDPGWAHNWTIMVLVSFIGTFGYLDVYMPYGLSKVYILLYTLGFTGIVWLGRQFHWKYSASWKTVNSMGHIPVKIKTIAVSRQWNPKGVFNLTVLAAMLLPPAILSYYAYFSDFQAQGRYALPALIPLMYFITSGYQKWMEKLIKKEKIRKTACIILIAFMVLSALYTYRFVIYRTYYGV